MNTTKNLMLSDTALNVKLVGDGDEYPQLEFRNHRNEELTVIIEAKDLVRLGKKLKKWGKKLADGTIDNE